MNKSTYGEELFEQYLISQGIVYEREPRLPGIAQLIDFVVDHPTSGKILLEVKDIENPLPRGSFSAFNPYTPIRTHIEEGTRKFKSTSDYVCALVLAAPPGSFVQLNEPHVILGAMYGDFGFRIPFDPDAGAADPDHIRSEFLVGNGKMVRKTRMQNTRIAALITVHAFGVWHYAMRKYMNTDDGRPRNERVGELMRGEVDIGAVDAIEVGVTVWDNAVAQKKLPFEIFRGEMDARWECSDEAQNLTFIGERRKRLGIDDPR